MANRALMLEVAERRRAEEQLRELNESLDRRVTERSEALRESEQRFRTMADQTPVMMWVANPAGAVEFVNKEYCVFFGVTSEEAMHSAWRLAVHDDDGLYGRALAEALRTPAAVRQAKPACGAPTANGAGCVAGGAAHVARRATSSA